METPSLREDISKLPLNVLLKSVELRKNLTCIISSYRPENKKNSVTNVLSVPEETSISYPWEIIHSYTAQLRLDRRETDVDYSCSGRRSHARQVMPTKVTHPLGTEFWYPSLDRRALPRQFFPIQISDEESWWETILVFLSIRQQVMTHMQNEKPWTGRCQRAC